MHLAFAGEGRLRHRHPDEQTEQALCLTLVVNAIIVWNTIIYTNEPCERGHVRGALATLLRAAAEESGGR